MLAVCGEGSVAAAIASDAAQDQSIASPEAVATAFDELNAEDFHVRSAAGDRLIQWAADNEGADWIAAEVRRRVAANVLSLEARLLLAPLDIQTFADEAPTDDMASAPSDEDLDRLIAAGDAPQYDQRMQAQARLALLGRHPAAAHAVTEAIKRRLRAGQMSFGASKRLHEIWGEARLTWIDADPATWPSANVGDDVLARWVSAAARPGGAAVDDAERELLDLIARDEQLPRIRAAIEAQLRSMPPEQVSERFQELHALTRDALLAEIWTERRNTTLQWLFVGEPQYPEDASRPTHFDRVDGNNVHCVSGNSLAEGNYPLGVANPPSRRDPQIASEGVAFHLMHLPTPRSRWKYERSRRMLSEQQRLAALTERTLRHMVDRGRAMSEREAAMLPQLDPGVLSSGIGEYFAKVDDAPCPADAEFNVIGQTSRHAMVCWTLALFGNRDAGPAILKAIETGRFLPRSPTAPFDLPMIAALAIASRDPWQDVDVWLAGLLDRNDLLILDQNAGPQLAASAAAVLLERAGAPLSDFDLQPIDDAHLQQLGCPAYRFSDAEGAKKVQRWWTERQRNLVSRAADHVDRL